MYTTDGPLSTVTPPVGEVIVQVVKDPLGNKGARLTTFITLPSRHLVLLPKGDSVGISARIENDDERERLRDMVAGLLGEAGLECGAIVRTVAEGASADELRADLEFLVKLWGVVQERCSNAAVKSLIHEDLSLPLRVLRDLVTSDVEKILVDSQADFEAMQEFAETFLPPVAPMLELYQRRRPIFDLHGIEDDIRKSLDRKIPLKSGGYVIFDQTEAMTTIDVNTGAFVGHRNLEETIFKTNLEAAHAIARQLRLRNLGGIIIIDFIDMEHEDHKRQVIRALERCLAHDHAKTHITEVSALGLVEMTRKRTRPSLDRTLSRECPYCHGSGRIKALPTICLEIRRELLAAVTTDMRGQLSLVVHPEVSHYLQGPFRDLLRELEEVHGLQVILCENPLFHEEQFEISG